MYKLLPDVSEVEGEFPFFDEMMTGLDDYFKSLSDTAMNVNYFHNMNQKAGELASAFALRLQRQTKVCAVDSDEVVRSLFLKIILDKTIAGDAYRQGWSLNVTVHAATREEASVKKAPSFAEVAAITAEGARLGIKRNVNRPVWSSAKRPRTEAQGKTCVSCGFRSHKDGVCKALDKTCYKCGRPGHFARACSKKEVAAVNGDSPDSGTKVLLLD